LSAQNLHFLIQNIHFAVLWTVVALGSRNTPPSPSYASGCCSQEDWHVQITCDRQTKV